MELVVFTYQLTACFPAEEKYGLISQIQSAAISIPSNIAEGCGRVSDKDFQRFISITMGSSFELETQMLLAFRFNYIGEEQLKGFEERIAPVQKMCFGLYNSLKNKIG